MMMLVLLRVAALLLLSLASTTAQEALEEDLTALCEVKIARDRIPGLSCAAFVGDRIVYARGFGLSDVENDVPATTETVYRLASISKPLTAVLVMQLVEEGALDLDQDLHGLVPEWPKKRWPVTTRQLLGHLGGVRHYQGEGESTRRYANQRAGLLRFAQDPLRHQPGTRYLYSTYGFNLAAAAVETLREQPFAEVLAATRNLSRKMVVWCPVDDRERNARLVAAIPWAVKHRGQGIEGTPGAREELATTLLDAELDAMDLGANVPMQIMTEITRGLDAMNERRVELIYQLLMDNDLTALHAQAARTDRLVGTPTPVSYSRHISRGLVLWLLALPAVYASACPIWVLAPASLCVALATRMTTTMKPIRTP